MWLEDSSEKNIQISTFKKKVVPGENYILVIDFDNGESGILDMKPFFGIWYVSKT